MPQREAGATRRRGAIGGTGKGRREGAGDKEESERRALTSVMRRALRKSVVSCEFAEENGGIRRADYLAYLKINTAPFIKQRQDAQPKSKI